MNKIIKLTSITFFGASLLVGGLNAAAPAPAAGNPAPAVNGHVEQPVQAPADDAVSGSESASSEEVVAPHVNPRARFRRGVRGIMAAHRLAAGPRRPAAPAAPAPAPKTKVQLLQEKFAEDKLLAELRDKESSDIWMYNCGRWAKRGLLGASLTAAGLAAAAHVVVGCAKIAPSYFSGLVCAATPAVWATSAEIAAVVGTVTMGATAAWYGLKCLCNRR